MKTRHIPQLPEGVFPARRCGTVLTPVIICLCSASSWGGIRLVPEASSLSEAQIQATKILLQVDRVRSEAWTVYLVSQPAGEIWHPSSVVVPSGTNAVTFAVEPVNDGREEELKAVELTAVAPMEGSATISFTVASDDTASPPHRTLGGHLEGEVGPGEYTVLKTVVVDAASTLRVAPGTRLAFAPGTGLEIAGRLLALGREEAPITLVAESGDPKPGAWTGLRLTSTRGLQSFLSFVEVQHAAEGIVVEPAEGPASGLVAMRVSVHDCRDAGVRVTCYSGTSVDEGKVLLADCDVYRNGQGVRLYASSSGCSGSSSRPWLLRCRVVDNSGDGVSVQSAWGGWSYCLTGTSANLQPRIEACEIRRNENGIYASASGSRNTQHIGGLWQNNLIEANRKNGFLLYNRDWLEPRLVNNTITGNGSAGAVLDGNADSGLRIQNCILSLNGRGFEKLGNTLSATNSWVQHNDLFSNTGGDWINCDPVYGKTVGTNPKGISLDVLGNVSVDPQFVGPADYHLKPGSPLVDAGTNEGAREFDFEGQARVGLVDLGWDEWVPPLTLEALRLDAQKGVEVGLVTDSSRQVHVETSPDLRDWRPLVLTNVAARSVFPIGLPREASSFFRAWAE